MNATHTGDWLLTVSGRAVYPLDLAVVDIDLEDIAHALSHQCRYAGHTRRFYSVAEHSVLLARYVLEETVDVDVHLGRMALLHDAAEAYLVDLPRPVKRSITGYAEIEARAESVIAAAFGLRREHVPTIKHLDERILADELAEFMRPAPAGFSFTNRERLGVELYGWSPLIARRRFLELAAELGLKTGRNPSRA